MVIKEAMSRRHTVRKYTDEALPVEVTEQLNQRIEERNKEYGTKMQLVTASKDGLNTFIKLFVARGVSNYIILAGTMEANTDEKLGYAGIDIALFAQTLGLNSWWVGETFNKGKVEKKVTRVGHEKVIGIIALGYGKEDGKPHKSKKVDEVSHYEGGVAPKWFMDGVNATLLAPTGLNKQNFHIEGSQDTVSITCDNGAFSGTELGIVRYHFELGAGKENFRWK